MLFNENDPALARRYGSLLTVVAAILGIVYAVGLARRSYWMLVAPVTLVVAATLAAAIALGRLLATTPDEAPDPAP
jgi:hypothetical protein